MSVGHAVAALSLVPRNLIFRSIIVVGLVAPWVWLVAIDSLLNRKR